MAGVVRDQDRSRGERVRRDHHVELADRLSGTHQLVPDFRVVVGGIFFPGENAHKAEETADFEVQAMGWGETPEPIK